MRNRSASGLALIAVGGVFIGVTNNASRSSTVGLIAGMLMILAGLVRIFRARKNVPPGV